jgi:hypothetical protein
MILHSDLDAGYAAAEEAVRLYRDLDADAPGRYEPVLQECLASQEARRDLLSRRPSRSPR